MEDDDLTTDTMATKAVLTPDGLCVKHPHVRLRGRDAQGHIVHRDSCYECDREFAQARRTLQERQQELDRQLQALDTSSSKTPTGAGSAGGAGSARKKNTNTDASVSSHSSMPAVPSPYPYYPPPPPHYYPGYGYPGAEAPHYPPPFGYPPPPPPPPPHNQYPPQQLYQPALTTSAGTAGKDDLEPPKRSAPGPSSPAPEGLKSSKEDAQLVALLQQKEQELKDLRHQLQDQQNKLTQETAALNECKQQLEQQAHMTEMLQTQHSHAVEQIQASFQQQLQSSNQQLEQQSQVTDLLQKQLEQLQLAFQQQLQALVQESQQQKDHFRKLLQEELASLRHALKEDIKSTIQVTAAPGAPRLASASPVLHGTTNAQHAPPPPAPLPSATTTTSATPKLDKPKMLVEPDDLDQSTVGTSEMDQHKGNAKDVPSTNKTNAASQLKKAPNHPWTSTTTNVNAASSSNNNNSAVPASKLKKPPDATGNETDEADELHLSADESLWSASNDLIDKETNAMLPPLPNNNTLPKEKPPVAASDRFTPKYVHPGDDDDDISHHPGESVDERSLEQTVASSTYGEDRQKVVSKQLLDPYGDKGVYTGVILRSTGMPHGLGRMIYDEDGRIYEGDWRHGRWHGYGRASFSNGDSYEGEYKFDQRHGRGVYKWNDGRVYDGHFSEDKRHGHGIFTWPDGAVYDGNFVNGQREGHGKYTFADGGQYEGSWKDGRYDGFGTCTWEDGRKYRGEWRNGMAHGHGVETYPNGNIRHEGQWEDDEPVR